jgi:uncharacterized protein YceK
MRAILIIVMVLSMYSCAMAERVKSARKLKGAPDNYSPVGIVEYSKHGWTQGIKNKHKIKAFGLMSDDCDGKYQIVNETEGAEETYMGSWAFFYKCT